MMLRPLFMLEIYTDGSCLGNPGPGGWGVLIKKPLQPIELCGHDKMTTNNKMELTAALEALKWVQSQDENFVHVTIFTDSTYLRDGITKWIHGWKLNNWRNAKKDPVKNKELWESIDKLSQDLNITWQWIKAHQGHLENEHVDKLAYRQALSARERTL